MRSLGVGVSVLVCAFVGCATDAVNPYIDPAPSDASDATTTSLVETGTTTPPDTNGPSPDAGTTPDAVSTPETTRATSPAAPFPTTPSGVAASPLCDLNGRWLLSQHVVAEALGATQASHNWFYYEISQTGTAVTVTKGLQWGYEVDAISTFGADVNSSGAWASVLAHNSDAGRLGTMSLAGSMCTFGLDKLYAVRGATVPYYQDPSIALPTLSQQESGCTPGWADWDNDGNPGITLQISGIASGSVYLVQRDWTQYAGSIAQSSTKFEVPVTWNTEASVLGDTNSIVATQGTADTAPGVNYVWWAKLTDTQAPATDSDSDICAAVRTLKDTLVPEANAN